MCPNCQQSFTETFETLYYRRQITPEQIRIVLQAHREGSSLRGMSRISKLAYKTLVSLIDAASQTAQMLDNQELQSVDKALTQLNEHINPMMGQQTG